MRWIYRLTLLLLMWGRVKAQPYTENMPEETDSLHAWWNLLHYTIAVSPDYNTKTIKGTNIIQFTALHTGRVMKIDLADPMKVTNVTSSHSKIKYARKGDGYLLSFNREIVKGDTVSVFISFKGKPPDSGNPPFTSGWIWKRDNLNRPWMSIACQGTGAAIWMPCKNVMYDEPDVGMSISITAPDTLIAVSNGRLIEKVRHSDLTTSWTWQVVNPINHYNIAVYIGKYVTWNEIMKGLNGNLDIDYWVLDYNIEIARTHFRQVDTLINFLEEWLGPYPFYEDGYKLVEAPMLGMEHQSAIAYGNGFKNGYLRGNISGTRWSELWDFILMHETTHEWFGNNITAAQDGWIHEGFTKYMETIYTEFLFGKEAGNEYALGINKKIKNNVPITGSNTSDKYNKGSAMLHSIRQVTGDSIFKKILKNLNSYFYHSTISTKHCLSIFNKISGRDFSKVFDQYLNTTNVPLFEYFIKGDSLNFHWTNCVEAFDLPLKISFSRGKEFFIYPETSWKAVRINNNESELSIDPNFYIQTRRY
ncbi:MAG: M1 family metallopeptidase [Chitinophagaceae bacterium]|nr:M1 family metallopeptidase [Chitinophagaceae bacterium]